MFRLKTLLLILIGVGAAFGLSKPFWSSFGSGDQELVYYTVVKSDLPILVTERGQLESQEQTVIRCKVETYDRSSGSSGISVLTIVPNGSVVKEGDVLVELDSASIRDLIESESLELQSDESNLKQAEARLKNQKTQNETATADAKLALELAKLNREMYTDPDSGTYRLAIAEIERQVDETRAQILGAQADMALRETTKDGVEQLYRLGYKGKRDLELSKIEFMKSEASLSSAINQLATHEATLKQMKDYTRRMELKKLDGEVATADRNLQQVQVSNESQLAQEEALFFESQERVNRQRSRIKTYKTRLANCTIRAPHDGMVVYAQDENGQTTMAVGRVVRSRQRLLTLPDLSRMQVKTQIHEAVLDQVHKGLPVRINVDAFPNKKYTGVVDHVAVVPSDSSKNVKTYECIVKIPGIVDSLKPGMTAVAEIDVETLKDVICVPVQAVVQVEGDTWCYVDSGRGVEKRFVELGRNNDKFVQIVKGIDVDDRVVLNPLAIANLENQDRKENDESEPASGNSSDRSKSKSSDPSITRP